VPLLRLRAARLERPRLLRQPRRARAPRVERRPSGKPAEQKSKRRSPKRRSGKAVMQQPLTHSGRRSPGINLSSHSSAVPAGFARPPRPVRAVIASPRPSEPPQAASRALKRSRAFALVVAIAYQLEREGVAARSRLVFRIARAAGAAPFRRESGLLWLAERRYGPRKLPPREARERSRRILIAVFRAIEQVDGKGRGTVSRARRAARVPGGATFDDHAAAVWLHKFKRPKADPRTVNLRQYQATRALLLAPRNGRRP
jgi:hypothetical protein